MSKHMAKLIQKIWGGEVCSSGVFFIRTSAPSFNVLSLLVDGLAAYGKPAVSLKVVFLPLLAFQATILIDNFR